MNIISLLSGIVFIFWGLQNAWEGLRYRNADAGLPLGKLLVPFWTIRLSSAFLLVPAGIWLLSDAL